MISNFRRGGKPCPVCSLTDGRHEEWCEIGANWSPEFTKPSGCGLWLLLIVGYIVALTAIGVSLIIISVEAAR
jgi:hypothetical protein